jgi:hypothetical protein
MQSWRFAIGLIEVSAARMIFIICRKSHFKRGISTLGKKPQRWIVVALPICRQKVVAQSLVVNRILSEEFQRSAKSPSDG